MKGEKGNSGEGGPTGPAGPPGQTVFQTADGAFNHSCMCTPGPPGRNSFLTRFNLVFPLFVNPVHNQ